MSAAFINLSDLEKFLNFPHIAALFHVVGVHRRTVCNILFDDAAAYFDVRSLHDSSSRSN